MWAGRDTAELTVGDEHATTVTTLDVN